MITITASESVCSKITEKELRKWLGVPDGFTILELGRCWERQTQLIRIVWGRTRNYQE